jgi:hypothetical protein
MAIEKVGKNKEKGAIPRWSEHKRKDAVGVNGKLLQDRQGKCDRLSRACLCVPYTVSAFRMAVVSDYQVS